MKSTILIFLAVMIVSVSVAYALKPELPTDGRGVKIHNFAPDGTKTVSLTAAKQTVDMTDDIGYEVYTPTACSYRSMTTATVAGTLSTLPANARLQRYVNLTTPFISFTGCTNGEALRQ